MESLSDEVEIRSAQVIVLLIVWSLEISVVLFIILTGTLEIGIIGLCSIFMIDYLYFRRRRFSFLSRGRVNISKKDIRDCEDEYNLQFNQYENLSSKKYFVQITRRLELICELIKDVNGNVLDIGCGSGDSSISLIRRNRKVFGLDISPSLLLLFKKRCSSITIIAGDAENIPFKEKSFKGIVMGDVLEHLLNPSKALGECKRILQKGGILVITTPTATGMLPTINPLIWLDQIFGIWYRKIIGIKPTVVKHVSGKPYFHTNFTYKELKRIITDAGFSVDLLRSDSPRWVFQAFEWLPMRVYRSLVLIVESLIAKIPFLRYMGYSWIVVAKKGE